MNSRLHYFFRIDLVEEETTTTRDQNKKINEHPTYCTPEHGIQTNVPCVKLTHCVSFDEQSAHALLEGKRCNLRTTSSGLSSAAAFLRALVRGVILASPGLDNMMFILLIVN